jgi:hypothetical protein
MILGDLNTNKTNNRIKDLVNSANNPQADIKQIQKDISNTPKWLWVCNHDCPPPTMDLKIGGDTPTLAAAKVFEIAQYNQILKNHPERSEWINKILATSKFKHVNIQNQTYKLPTNLLNLPLEKSLKGLDQNGTNLNIDLLSDSKIVTIQVTDQIETLKGIQNINIGEIRIHQTEFIKLKKDIGANAIYNSKKG